MEDGSIFVCFLCEKEFRQVALLNEHMKEHGSLPEMNEDFPRKKPKVESKKTLKGKLSYTVPQSIPPKNEVAVREEPKVVKYDHHSMPDASVANVDKTKTNINPQSTSKPKLSTVTSASTAPRKGQQYPPSHKKVVVKQEPLSPLPSPDKVKPDPDSQTELSIAMQRAMKVKRYIERKENTAKRKLQQSVTPEETNEDITEINDEMEYEGPRESIMMVDASFFTSGTQKTPIGPTIMNAEPDGFMVPEKVNSGTQSSAQRRKRQMRISNDNYVQDIYYDAENTSTPNGYSRSVLNQVEIIKSPRGRGRGRGKRGRPIRIKEEMDEEYEERVGRSGRRSRRRSNSMDDEEIEVYQCSECFKEFRSVNTMKVHMKSHSEVREIPCPYCDEVFPQRYILYEHLINDHEESSNLTCPICNKIFTRPDSLKSHMVRMHEENGGLNCYVCGKNFPSQGQLEMHLRVHTGERPFKCELCSKGFVQKVHLRTHLRTMHNISEMNCTPCRICDKMFDGRSGLREHYTAVHGLTTASYKNQVAKLRKEGKIPEIVPPKVKVVDPSFRYQKVAIAEMEHSDDAAISGYDPSFSAENGVSSKKRKTTTTNTPSSTYLTRRQGKKLKIKTSPEASSNAPGMGTVMNLVSDEVMFTPVNFGMDGDQPKGRDQEELNFVESAFKVAEEMDQMRDGSSTLLMADDSSSSAGIYYSFPLQDAEDDEYAQFAAEHAHIDGMEIELDLEEEEEELEHQPKGATSSFRRGVPTGATSSRGGVHTTRRGAIVKAEPLEIFSDAMEATQPIEMLTM